mmetsp:Transcript_29888/g.61453  ORF Transcript_29888/g.61453 Transcript_29888/m.61453 type:complete len:245 (-) Transcript_29888:246-980(-)
MRMRSRSLLLPLNPEYLSAAPNLHSSSFRFRLRLRRRQHLGSQPGEKAREPRSRESLRRVSARHEPAPDDPRTWIRGADVPESASLDVLSDKQLGRAVVHHKMILDCQVVKPDSARREGQILQLPVGTAKRRHTLHLRRLLQLRYNNPRTLADLQLQSTPLWTGSTISISSSQIRGTTVRPCATLDLPPSGRNLRVKRWTGYSGVGALRNTALQTCHQRNVSTFSVVGFTTKSNVRRKQASSNP